ncbi:alpha/beta hydrolase fold domain-containing protein [Spirillospora sp. NPDC047279]|uniref:alpha/beta hydrolase fold domain-containing protein n=1 Tax=Spirillospora sp. NPDC047279 TaxID=3155478 RepID=UPI0033D7714F
MQGDIRVQASPAGLVVLPPAPAGAAVLYLSDGRGSPLDLAGLIAERTGAIVVCARYRPEFPAALDDALDAYRQCEPSGRPVAVVGDRMGAGLAAALLVSLRDSGAVRPGCAVLVSPLLDLTMRAPSLQLNASADPTFDLSELQRRVARYAADAMLTDPLLSPLYANLHGLPPVRLLAAGTDPLLDDSLAFAARAARSGVTVDLRVRPDAASLRAEADTDIAGFVRAFAGAAPAAGKAVHPA